MEGMITNAIHRAYHYGEDYPGLEGKTRAREQSWPWAFPNTQASAVSVNGSCFRIRMMYTFSYLLIGYQCRGFPEACHGKYLQKRFYQA